MQYAVSFALFLLSVICNRANAFCLSPPSYSSSQRVGERTPFTRVQSAPDVDFSFAVPSEQPDALEAGEDTNRGVIHGANLVAGNMIGAGILALPTATETSGFLPSSLAMTGIWGIALVSAMLIAEVCASGMSQGRLSIKGIAEATLGPVVGSCVGIGFLFSNLLYSVAYISEGSRLVSEVPAMANCGPVLGECMANMHLAPIMFTMGCGALLLAPAAVERCNNFLVAVILLSFGTLVSQGAPTIDLGHLMFTAAPEAVPAVIPIVVCALVYHNIVPSVVRAVDGDLSKARQALTLGSGLPLLMYITWDAVMLGNSAMPEGLDLPVRVLSVAALITSFWGSSISIQEEASVLFMNALERIRPKCKGTTTASVPAPPAPSKAQVPRVSNEALAENAATLCALVPPAMMAMACPDMFMTALSIAGSYGDPILYGAMPALMGWHIRNDPAAPILVPGGKPAMGATMALVGAYVGEQVFSALSLS